MLADHQEYDAVVTAAAPVEAAVRADGHEGFIDRAGHTHLPGGRLACGPVDSGAVRLIWLKNIGRDGAIAEPDPEVDDWRSDAPERLHLYAGDILLSSVTSGRPKAAPASIES